MKDEKNTTNSSIRWTVFILVLSAVIFIIDLLTPLGIADAISYVAVVLVTIWVRGVRSTNLTSLLAILLTVLGFVFSPPGNSIELALTNRGLAVFGILTASLVIRKYKISQEEVLRHKETLSALFMHASEGILFTDESGNIIMVNPKTETIFGYTAGEMNSLHVKNLLPAGEKGKELLQEYLSNKGDGKEASFEMKGLRKDGTEFFFEVGLTHFIDNNQQRFIAFINDITLRKEQEARLKAAFEELVRNAEELRASNADLENFAYISSHDLQEPLRKIQSFGDRLKLVDSAKMSDEGRDYLTRILNAASRMQRLINDLLSFSRVSSRAQPYERVDLNEVLTEVLSDLEVLVEQAGARIEKNLLPVIDADPTQIRQLFQNIIANAIKFRKDDVAPVISIWSEEPNHEGKQSVNICFRDNGIGFDEKYLEKIFNIFQRLEGKKYEGSGIGLAICRKIAVRHGGNITANSRPGEGATFVVTLPVEQTEISLKKVS